MRRCTSNVCLKIKARLKCVNFCLVLSLSSLSEDYFGAGPEHLDSVSSLNSYDRGRLYSASSFKRDTSRFESSSSLNTWDKRRFGEESPIRAIYRPGFGEKKTL